MCKLNDFIGRNQPRRAACLAALLVTVAVTRVSAQGGPTLIVDPSGAGNYTTIQAAVNAVTNAAGPRTILVRAGTYTEAVNISAKNTGATSDAQRLIIQADPQATRGTVIVTPPANDSAFHIHQCKFITLDGFTVTGVTGNQNPAIKLGGGSQDNQDVTVSGNDIRNNSSHGIEVQAGNARTWLINNLIRHNGTSGNTGEGIKIVNGNSTQPVYLLNNTIYANRFNGVFCQKPRVLWVVNNLIVGNGTDTDPNNTLNKNGLRREASGSATEITLLANMFYNNKLGDLKPVAELLDAADSGNRTTLGNEGTGVAGCVFTNCSATTPATAIFVSTNSALADLHLVATAPAIDTGVNSFNVGTNTYTISLDYAGTARPLDGDGNGTATADIGGYEAPVPANPPQLVVSPASRNFGTVGVGATNSLTFSVINTGGSALTGTAATAAPFAVTAGSPYNVAPGQTGTVSVAFAPSAVSGFTNNVIFASNGGASTNALTGTGTIPTAWLVAHGLNPNDPNVAAQDPDGDGLTNLLEYQGNTDPQDYYNGVLPGLAIVSGNNQSGMTNTFLPQSLVVALTAANSAPLNYAPVTFSVSQGQALLAATVNDTPLGSVSMRTDVNGQSAVVVLLSAQAGTNLITVTANSGVSTTAVTFSAVALAVTEAPVFSVAGGNHAVNQLVAISDATVGATIHYTITGIDPTESDPVIASGGTVLVDRALTLKARAFQAGAPPSGVTAASYRITGAVAVGVAHTVALGSDGAVWAWGANWWGQLGIGSYIPNSTGTPMRVTSLTNTVAVAAGLGHTLAIANGSVWSWGYNNSGQLGNGTTSDAIAPQAIAGLSGATAVACGENHSLALLADGTVRAWGLNAAGQLGDGTTTLRSAPVAVSGLSSVTALAGGERHSVALLADGTVWTWGDNTHGQLGDGTTNGRTTPAVVPGLNNVVAIAAGDLFTVAVRADGTVWGWGDNTAGQLGDGSSNVDRLSPVQMSGITDAVGIAAGNLHTLVTRAAGSVQATGLNSSGQFGDGTITSQTQPVASGLLSNVVVVAARWHNSVAVTAGGVVLTCGVNEYGQLGDGRVFHHDEAVRLSAASPAKWIAAGNVHSLAGLTTGPMQSWGANWGLLGDGSAVSRTGIVAVAEQRNFVAGAAGAFHSAAVSSDGRVWTWGRGDAGQLGNGTLTNQFTPQAVSGLTGSTRVACGENYTLALLANGTVRAWGANHTAQLGDGTTTTRTSPVSVNGLSGIVRIAAAQTEQVNGGVHSLAVGSDGHLWAWGDNTSGQLGDGTTVQRSTPVMVHGLTNVIDAAAGEAHSVALTADGQVWTWGKGTSGQLANGLAASSVPKPVTGVHNAVAVTAGLRYTAALLADGTVRAWGANWNGMLGDRSTVSRGTQSPVVGLTDIVAISASRWHALALDNTGQVWGWGFNAQGQLTDGTLTMRPTPYPVSQVRLNNNPDTDGDGIPTDWELTHGLDPNDPTDGGLDSDGDGLTNLQEYQHGTNPHNGDSDGDGMTDGWEVQYGLDPNNAADATADADSDGWNNLAEFGIGTNPQMADTPTDALTINGSDASGTLGSWQVNGTEIYAMATRGYVEYTVNLPQADVYRLVVEGRQNYGNSSVTTFNLQLSVDGELVGSPTLTATPTTYGTVEAFLPFLPSGPHTVRIFWDNLSSVTSLRIKSLKLQSFAGPDLNNNGVKDWVDLRLAQMSSVDTNSPTASYVSPVCLEGRGPYASMTTIATVADGGGFTTNVVAQSSPNGRWYANVPLADNTNSVVTVSHQNGGRVQTGHIQWTPLNVAGGGEFTIRTGDSLLLTAYIGAGAPPADGTSQLTVGATQYSITPNAPVAHLFDTAGTYTVTGSYTGPDGEQIAGSVTVNVLAFNFPSDPACWVGTARNWDVPGLSTDNVVEADAGFQMTQTDLLSGNVRRYQLLMNTPGLRPIIARTGPGGPILDRADAVGTRLYSDNETYSHVIETYPDGSQLVETLLVVPYLAPGMTVEIEIFVAGVFFEDGTTLKVLTAADFDSLGQYRLRFIKAYGVTTAVCHFIRIYDNGVLIGQR